jgi:hypothetical protein
MSYDRIFSLWDNINIVFVLLFAYVIVLHVALDGIHELQDIT